MSKYDIDVIARLLTSDDVSKKGVGHIVLGPKRNGELYNKTDIDTLEIIANELVLAVQNALRFEEIKKFSSTLQEKVDESTRKLRKSNERLRLLDQTKDDFISMASHQLRTPLTSVKGYVSMVLDGDAGPINATQRKLLTQAFLSSQRMVYLISDLLNVSRLKTGKFIIEPVESRLDKVIEEELEQLTETIKSRGLTLEYHKPERFPTLMLDETKIRQVIMNFVDNAIYYTPSGGSIDVYLEDKGKSVEFRVVDTGIGVPRHEQHHLFTKFYRASNAKNARPDGTGLGIFMAKKVIIAQGGAVIFRSTEGKGSTFGFTFPKAKLLPKPTPKAEQPAAV
ncbi:HAMP domain-containing histidine kinase [Candidatus Saccharibacteria bacterium]|nr:HAMP domain-containing histidine kinase [Candidatus Saccharibacteria bacterium]